MLANVHLFECPGKVEYNSLQEYAAALIFSKRNTIETLKTIANVMSAIGTEESVKKAQEAVRLMMEEMDPAIKDERNKSLQKMAESFKEFEGQQMLVVARDHSSKRNVRSARDAKKMRLSRRRSKDASDNPT